MAIFNYFYLLLLCLACLSISLLGWACAKIGLDSLFSVCIIVFVSLKFVAFLDEFYVQMCKHMEESAKKSVSEKEEGSDETS